MHYRKTEAGAADDSVISTAEDSETSDAEGSRDIGADDN